MMWGSGTYPQPPMEPSLEEYSGPLKDAGLDRVNVSFDTLNPETYRFITKKGLS